MDMKKRRDMQLAYISDEAVMEEQIKCRKILQKLNFADRSDFDGIAEMVKELGITPEDKSVIVSFEDGKIIIEKKKNS